MEEYTQITLDEWTSWKEDIRRKLAETAGNFVYIGYRIKQIRDSGMYDGASDIFEFAQKEYGLGKSTVSRFIAINEKYSEGGNSLELKEEFKAFSSSKLSEMLTLPDSEIELITEKTTIREIRELKNFNQQEPEPEQEEGKRIFQITDQKKLDHIINLLGFDPQQNLVLHINFGMVEETCDRAAFLRGAFFAGGSITDPQKRYHLELTTSHLQVSRELNSLLQECGYPPKSLSRGGSLITYFKQSDQIEDFLTLIGAPVAAMNVMSAKLEKDLRNSVNRRLNCDSANLDKAVEAAQEQMEAIRRLQAAELLEQLPDKLQETAALRLEYPELSLSELAAEFDPPVSKSCLNHRLRKLLELARDLSE